MKKILLLANNSGGLYDFRKDLIKGLCREYEVVACTPFDIKADELKALGLRLIETPIDRRGINPLTDIKLYRLYKSILKKEKPDLVITYTIKPNVYGGFACRKGRVPYAINITGLGTAFQSNGLIRKIVTVMYKAACKKARIVFFENAGNRNIFVDDKIVRIEKTHVLNGAGVNLEQFAVLPYPRNDKTRFLFIGRIMKEKGIDELLVATQMLVKDGLNIELQVLGEFEEEYQGVFNEYQKEGWLLFEGYQQDVRPFIEKANCFVLPSWHEGMANTNLECAASGRPVITTNIYGCKEAVENEVSGYLVNKQDVDDLYEKMKKFVQLPYDIQKNMGLNGRKRMEEIFDKKKVVEDTISCLK